MFNFQIQPTDRTSTAVEKILVNPVQGTVTLRFKSNGYEYKYSNVSRAKILNLLINDNMSLGFWVNNNLLPYDCKTRLFGECTVVSHFDQLMNQQPVAV